MSIYEEERKSSHYFVSAIFIVNMSHLPWRAVPGKCARNDILRIADFTWVGFELE